MDRIEQQELLSLYFEQKEKGTFEYIKALDEFKRSEYYEFYRFLKTNRQVIAILRHNYSQLIDLVDYHNSPKNQSKVWNDTNSKYRWRQQKMITTQLFNYLASVFATVDYSRSKLSKYIIRNSEIASNFKLGIKNYFDNNQQHKFIQDLRNYTSHNSYLRITTEFKSDSLAEQIKREIYLSKEELLSSDKWSSLSREFLNAQDAKVYIIDIIKSHFPLFTEFQDWTYLALLQVNPQFTSEFKDNLKSILEFSEKVSMTRTTLPFGHSYIKYLDLIVKESANRCNFEFKYIAPAFTSLKCSDSLR